MKRKTLSLLLTLTMIFSLSLSLTCITTFADTNSYSEINSIDDLYNVRNNMSGNYKLMSDIDMTDEVATGGKYNYSGKGWEPFGATTQTEFTGVFDGNGHSITGLSITGLINSGASDANSNALFWTNNGTIKNLRVYGSISASNGYNDALIAGINKACISNCSADGQINMGTNAGLIAGKNSGTIDFCQSKGAINAIVNNAHSGGICGSASSGQITHCYNSAAVKTVQYSYDGSVCGIVGYADSSVAIMNCYNAGTITGSYYYYQSYGFSSYTTHYVTAIGIANGGTVNNCYNAGTIQRERHINSGYEPVEISGYPIGGNSSNCYYLKVDGLSSNSSDRSLNEIQMTMQESFEGFDFENVWIIDPGADYKYPQLRNCRQDLGREIDMIELKSAPDKITYKTGDEFDPTGCVVTVFYKDNGSEDIDVTTEMLSGYDMDTAGIQDVKFSYRGYSLSFKINVNQRPEIEGMELTSQPLKTTFIRGTEFDFTGAIAQIRYSDNTTEDFIIDAKDCTGGDINTSGNYTITFTKFGYSVTFDVSVVPVREEGIHIESLPNKISYIEGEDIDIAGLVVNVDYNSGETAPITDYTIAEYNNSAGVQTITVLYKTFETTFEVSFAEKNVLSIEVTKQPDKTEYVFGQLFDPTGMVVTANLDNGKTEEVTDYVVSPMEDRNGMQDLTISYAGKTTLVTVFVTKRALDSISITTKPYKLTYIEGSDFDPTGMVVTAKYNDGSTETITDYTLSKLGRTPGNKTITVSYNGKVTTLAVTVIAKTVVSLTVTAPNKVNYVKGEDFDPTGMVVTALYNDGETEEITDYSVAGFGESEEVNILEVSYGGKTESIVVTIHDPGDWEVTVKPTCTDVGHEARKCKECGDAIETREIESTGHSFGSWVTVNEPTCVEPGLEERLCTKCDQKDKRSLATSDHTEEVIPSVPATCTSKGKTAGSRCSVCEKVIKAQTDVPALGHTLGEAVRENEVAPNCLENGSYDEVVYCTVCKSEISRTNINIGKAQHKLIEIAAEEATTTSEGNIRYWTCSVCNKFFSDSEGSEEITKDQTVLAKKEELKPSDQQGDDEQKPNSQQGGEKQESSEPTDAEKVTAEARVMLDNTITDAKKVEQGNFTNESFKVFQDAITEGETISANPKATAEQLKAAFTKIVEAKKAMKEKEIELVVDPIEEKGVDGTALGQGASAKAAEAAIAGMTSDNDLPGLVFGKLQLKSKKQTKTSITLSWMQVTGAKTYAIYGNKCGKAEKMQRLAVSSGKSITFKKILGNKIKRGTYYKFMIIALDNDNKVVSSSKIIHVATKGGKNGNPTKVTISKKVKKNKITVKAGKTFKLEGKAAGKKVKKHVAVRYESSNPEIATVSKKGVIKGLNKGKCKIHAFAQNGVCTTVNLTIK